MSGARPVAGSTYVSVASAGYKLYFARKSQHFTKQTVYILFFIYLFTNLILTFAPCYAKPPTYIKL